MFVVRIHAFGSGEDVYLDGLAYARIVDFGDGENRLLVCYHDPSRGEDPATPGAYPESYPIEVWEYDSQKQEAVYEPIVDGQTVSESEVEEHESRWSAGDVETIYLTALASSDRSVEGTVHQTKDTLEALGLSGA